jgi:hypothetical protein
MQDNPSMATHRSGVPVRDEAAPYYFKYIDRVAGDDIVAVLAAQLPALLAELGTFTEDSSRFRYAPDRWSVREVVAHVNDGERLFLARAFWFARGFTIPLPSFDPDACAALAPGDDLPWAAHLEELRSVREATLSFYRNLPAEAWTRRGTASDVSFTVRAMAFLAAGHADHHAAVLREKYRG